MTKVGIISDTHAYWDDKYELYLGECDEIWHAGDIGSPPDLFISGHSHILKIMPDKSLNLLHINPGAAGMQGWHKERTLVRLTIESNKFTDCEVITLGQKQTKL